MLAKKEASLRHIRRNSGGATGQPIFGSDDKAAIPVVVPGAAVSLDQLLKHNEGVKIKKAVPPKDIPINQSSVAPGQPIFSMGAGPGTANEGVGKPTQETKERIKSGRGGRV
jgi:hypothetical protein